jgi:NAD(P)-dependent dehydrogenase (short-subunit alcohol dehydrogenase family)
MKIFQGKVAIVTGAASGIGRAVSERLAAYGAKVIATDIDNDKLNATVAHIREAGGHIDGTLLDVTDAAAVAEVIRETDSQHGQLDYLFNNAGIGVAGAMHDLTLDEWYRLFDVNVRGVIHGVHAAYPLMIEQGHGHIVNTASISGLLPTPGMGAYSATKHAVVGLSRALRVEGAPQGVKVTAVCPGLVETPIIENIEFSGDQDTEPDRHEIKRQIPFRLYPVDKCARAILKGVARNKAVLIVVPHAHAMHAIHRLSSTVFNGLAGLAAKRMFSLLDDQGK